jgi:hypothetical protein
MKAKFLSALLLCLFLFGPLVAQAQAITLVSNMSKMLGSNNYRVMESIEMGGKLYFSTWSDKGTHLWAAGRIVHQARINPGGQDKLNLGDLRAGAYFIRLTGNAPPLSASLIIER